MRRFGLACGNLPSDYHYKNCSAPVVEHVDNLLDVAGGYHPVLGLVAIYAIESQSAEATSRLETWLHNYHGFNASELEWFSVHGTDDIEHAEDGLELIVQYADDVKDFENQSKEVIARICGSWLKLHDYYLRLLSSA